MSIPPRNVVYRYRDALGLNLTNRCPTACAFCVKFASRMVYRGLDLGLQDAEPTIAEVLEAATREWELGGYAEAVFCGYGESTLRFDALTAVCDGLRAARPGLRLRLNTVGLADLQRGKPAAPELRGRLDAVYVSLNTSDPRQWLELLRPQPPYREKGFQAVQDFIRSCVASGFETTATAVELPEVDLEACRRLAESLGARFLARPYLESGEMKSEGRA